MKVLLPEIEQHITSQELEEARELVNISQEFDISQVEEGSYHFISRQPDYHVEITIRKDGIAVPKCQCTVFKRHKQCKHAIAALLLLRDQIQRQHKGRRKSGLDKQVIEEVAKKLNITELRSFLTSYASSHAALRNDFLSQYLHHIRNPNYHNLFLDVAPLDKYGQVRLNRNSIKSVRAVSSNLLKQAQQLLRDKALSETLQILEAVILHLHRIWAKVPQFQEQMMADLRMAYKLFEALCSQQMAPRLQVRAIHLAMEICNRDQFIFPSGMRPLIAVVEPFLLEEKLRKTAFQLAEKRAKIVNSQQVSWAGLVYRWMRIWSFNISNQTLLKTIENLIPSIIMEYQGLNQVEDILYLIFKMKPEDHAEITMKTSLQAGLKASRSIYDIEMTNRLAYRLALNHLDIDAWDLLKEKDPVNATRLLTIIEDMYQPNSDVRADAMLLHAWQMNCQGTEIIKRLKAMDQIELLVNFDFLLKDQFRNQIAEAYAGHILDVREAYGGVNARQKLNTIFAHLKTIDIFQIVAEKIKEMEQTRREETNQPKTIIKGFVFDLDGVIVDTAVHHFSAWRMIMHELGVEIEESDDHHTRGAGRMESLEYLLNRYQINLTQEEKEAWAAKKNDIYVKAIHEITPADLLPGALFFLQESKKAGLLCALGSASKNAKPVIEKLGVKEYFDAILDGNDAKASKPDPEIFTKAYAALHLKPEEVVVFEDASKGVQAALSAGCFVVGIGDLSSLSAAHFVVSGLDKINPSTVIERLA